MTATRPGPPAALTIAGSDSGGGAGIQADLDTFAAHGVHGLCAITAITAQNTRAVSAIAPTPARMVQAQLDAVFDDFRVRACNISRALLRQEMRRRRKAGAFASRIKALASKPVMQIA